MARWFCDRPTRAGGRQEFQPLCPGPLPVLQGRHVANGVSVALLGVHSDLRGPTLGGTPSVCAVALLTRTWRGADSHCHTRCRGTSLTGVPAAVGASMGQNGDSFHKAGKYSSLFLIQMSSLTTGMICLIPSHSFCHLVIIYLGVGQVDLEPFQGCAGAGSASHFTCEHETFLFLKCGSTSFRLLLASYF